MSKASREWKEYFKHGSEIDCPRKELSAKYYKSCMKKEKQKESKLKKLRNKYNSLEG